MRWLPPPYQAADQHTEAGQSSGADLHALSSGRGRELGLEPNYSHSLRTKQGPPFTAQTTYADRSTSYCVI